ncbi:protein with ysrik-signal peptide, partial [Streptococcus infantis]
PSTKTPVKDTANLTDAEKAKVKEAVEAANPGSKAEVGQDGTTTVTFPDGSTATLTGDQTVKTADSNGVQAPSTKTPVKDTANLTDAEKAKVKEAVEAANPGSKAEVGQDGTTTVTFPDASTATLTGDQTVKTADANGVQAPSTKTPVKDTANLTDAEKAKVKEVVEAANPGSKAEVGQDGTTTVTFPGGSTATLTGDQTVKTADANGVKAPSTKTPVKDAANLTDDEKAEVKKAVEAANPGSVAEVGQDGTTTVTFPDGSTATLTGDQTVKAADANGVKAPTTKTPVKDTAKNLTDAEKAKVKEAVEAANPGSKAEVGQDGTTTVTFPDGSTATLTGDQTVKTADANGVQAPSTKTPVKDTANLTDAEKAEVKKAVEAANPGSVAEVGQDGTTKVTFPDKSEGTLTPEQTVVKAEEKAKDADGLKAPETKTPVKDTANLTDAEKAKVKEAVEAANPGSKAEVGQDGTTTVTFPDGSTATLTGDQTVK